jgi:methylenetetrahydrofolate reductase (NADPH)
VNTTPRHRHPAASAAATTLLERVHAQAAEGPPAGLDVSFEFFPPATPAGADKLWQTVTTLESYRPRYVSMTYGAGGSTQARTIGEIERIITNSSLAVVGHLTTVGHPAAHVDAVIDRYLELGVGGIVALRGDPPEGSDDGGHPDGYPDAAALVAAIRARSDVKIAVGAYPETHPRAASPEADLDNLKRKIDAGADVAITQFFFDTDLFDSFVDRVRTAGIDVPIVPGIMPIVNLERVHAFADRCGATVPVWVDELYVGLDDDPDARAEVSAALAADQCRRLAAAGADSFHFYTLNQPGLTTRICDLLGVASA